MLRRLLLLLLSLGLIALVTPALAQLPYNPSRVIPARNGSVAYILSPQPSSSQFSLSSVDFSETLNATSPRVELFNNVPFLSPTASRAFVTIPGTEDITVLAGDCKDDATGIELWRFAVDDDSKNGTWSSLPLSSSDPSFGAKYLSAGFLFSPTTLTVDVSLYLFGGMCPDGGSSDATDWTSDATYSNTMLTLAPNATSDNNSPYELSLTGARAPPIAEAGLTITALTPTFSNSSDTNVSQQQNFVLLGGHTQTAFINMSQLAIFSLPQESWAFVGVSQSPRDSVTIEPRSGHTAILTDDGSRIVVFGGWVGDISTPAQPQLVILEIGQGYGGQGNWMWTIPASTSNPFLSEGGMYGHGAAMLPGGVMMVSGGWSIGSSGSKHKRAPSQDALFFNTTTFDWADSYTNPYPPNSSPGSVGANTTPTGLKSSEKAGLGAGLGLGLAAAAGVAIVWLLYSRKLRAKRAIRERELRAQALGSRYQSPTPPDGNDQTYSGFRTASWGAAQERHIENAGDPYPWAPVTVLDQNGKSNTINDHGDSNFSRYAERTGVSMETPSPTRGLRKSLSGRAAMGFGPFNQHPASGVPGAVFRIDEEDESSQAGSSKRARLWGPEGDRQSVASDPFKDPPPATKDAAQRQKEVDGWVEDWQSAAETMSVSRSTSQAYSRTYSNLSQSRPQGAAGNVSGRGSPERSDRTGSNLSESSALTTSSFQRSVPDTLSRNVSQRSVSAGYALFAGAAAAMTRFGYNRQGQVDPQTSGGLARAPSNRSVSLNTDSAGHLSSRPRAEMYSSLRDKNPWGPVNPVENQALLIANQQRQPLESRNYRTLPETQPKEKYSRAGSITSSGRRAINLLGSVKRVFTGTGSVDVQDRVTAFEYSSSQSSPTKYPEMMEVNPSSAMSAGGSFWRGKRGAKDWDSDIPGQSEVGPSIIQRKAVPGLTLNGHNGALHDEDEDWDVETAIQKRVVQVMFTVPKEKLRVVNADALSLLSSNRSEADHEEDKERDQMKRMSSVREGDEYHDPGDRAFGGKGKQREF